MAVLKRATTFLAKETPVKLYPFIEAEKVGQRNVGRACQLLKVSRSAYYAAGAANPVPERARTPS